MKRIYLPVGWDPATPLVMHAMAHSIDGDTLLRDECDQGAFERTVQHAAEHSQVQVLAYCPNGNHYHLLLFGTTAQTGRFMHKLQTALSRRFRVKYGGRGHVFMRPYLAAGKVGRTCILDCWAYVNANPFKDGLSDSLLEGTRSSLPYFLGLGSPPSFLYMKPIHDLLVNGSGESLQAACRRFLLDWVSTYPKILRATAEALQRAEELPRGGFRHPERVTQLISMTQSLILQFTRQEEPGSPPPWLAAAQVLRNHERLTIREVAVLVRKPSEAVRRGLKRLL
jgi:REP element-mobilizing transposase RayT